MEDWGLAGYEPVKASDNTYNRYVAVVGQQPATPKNFVLRESVAHGEINFRVVVKNK